MGDARFRAARVTVDAIGSHAPPLVSLFSLFIYVIRGYNGTEHVASSATALVGKDTPAKVGQVSLVALDALAHVLGPLLALCEVDFQLLPVAQVVGNDGVHIGQCCGGVALDNGFGGRAILKRTYDQFDQYTRGSRPGALLTCPDAAGEPQIG